MYYIRIIIDRNIQYHTDRFIESDNDDTIIAFNLNIIYNTLSFTPNYPRAQPNITF